MNSPYQILYFLCLIEIIVSTDSYLQTHTGITNNLEQEKIEGEAFHRDGWGRNDPNQLLNGFFPVWAILLIGLAGLFILISIVSFVGYMLGCKKPKSESGFKKLSSNQI